MTIAINAKQRRLVQAISLMLSSPALLAAPSLEEVIVSARKTDEALQQVPVAVSAFTAKDLEAMNIVQTSDISRTTPSVFIEPPAVGNATSAKVTIRGQNQSDNLITLDPSIGWYLDDVYLARAYATVGSIYDAERVEVLKGPQGTLYGRNTTGGAVKIITSKAQVGGGVEGYITGGVGNYNAQKLGGAINIPVIENMLAVRLVALKDKADGWGEVEVHSPFSPFPIVDADAETGDRDTEMYRMNITLEPTEGLAVHAGYEHSDVEASTMVRNTAPGGDGFGLFPNSTDFYKTKLNFVPRSTATAETANITIDYDITDTLATKFIYGWRMLESKFASEVDGTAVNISGSRRPGPQEAKQTSYEWQVSGTAANDLLDWITGLYYFTEDGFDQTENFGLLTGFANNIIYGKGQNDSKSVFFNGTLHLTDRLNFTGGIRYTKDDKSLLKRLPQTDPISGVFIQCLMDPTTPNFDASDCSSRNGSDFEFISWTAGFDYTLADDVMVYLKASEASRSGGQNMRGVDANTSEPFDPETATDIELGIKSQFWDNRARLNADYYHTFYQDVQQTQLLTTANGLATKVVNAARGSIDGVEVEFTAALTDSLTATVSGSWLNWQFDDPNSILPAAPEWQSNVRLDYVVPVGSGELTVSGNYSYRGEYLANAGGGRPVARTFDPVHVDDLGLFGARISYDLESMGLNVALWGNNLTDEEYTVNPLILYFPPALEIATATVGEPRTYGIEVTKRF